MTKYPRPLEVRYADIFEEIRQSDLTKAPDPAHAWQLPPDQRTECEGSGCWKRAVLELRDRQDVALGRFCQLCGDRTLARLRREVLKQPKV